MQKIVWWLTALTLVVAALALCVACSSGDDDDDDDDSINDDDDDDQQLLIDEFVRFEVQGSDSLHGDYSGLVEVRAAAEGPNFARSVAYDELTFDDPWLDVEYEVHSAWSGGIDLYSGEIALELEVADFMAGYDGLERNELDGEPIVINGQAEKLDAESFRVEYRSADDAAREFSAEESWTLVGPSESEPLYEDNDYFVSSHEPMPEFLHNLIWAMITGYHSLEFYEGYRDRPEFQLGVHYFSRFRSDFDWYREHPAALRLRNRWIDEISMAEEMIRARSYSPTLARKAQYFDAEMQSVFLNPQGMVSRALIGSDPLQIQESYDGLLWTGCYLASQAYRYLETADPEALANWLRALESLFLCQDVVQDPTTFARTVRYHDGEPPEGWHQADPPYEQYDWRSPGNNDMIQGLFYGYTISWLLLPNEPEYDALRQGIAQRAALIADHNGVALDGQVNELRACLLAYMTTGEQRFFERYEQLAVGYLDTWHSIGNGMIYAWGISDWSGQHLNTVGSLTYWFLVQAADPARIELLQEGWINGMRGSGPTRQALWPIASYAFADPPTDLDWVLEESLWSLREFPYPKQNFEIDLRVDPDWCASPLPCLPWKFDWMNGGRHQGLYSVPFFQRDVSTNYFVSGAFSFEATASDWSDGGGADYLHAYWLARFFNIIGPEE
ncbi:MAG: hypothetical protein P9M14_07445 [Candidatus Alcyoniella australis]|nr:hypothetical protein [Candidatus Alcyoniella australis]